MAPRFIGEVNGGLACGKINTPGLLIPLVSPSSKALKASGSKEIQCFTFFTILTITGKAFSKVKPLNGLFAAEQDF